MSKASLLLLGPVLAGGLAACAGDTVGPAYLGNYDPSMLRYAAGRGPMYTEVLGNPFAAPKENVERAVTGAMTGAHFGPLIHFSTVPDPDNPSPYRVVVLFNPGPGASPDKLCRREAAVGGPAGEPVRVLAAFCAGDYREASITGRIAGARGPDDPAFRTLIRRMTAQMFPPRNPNLQNGGRDFDT